MRLQTTARTTHLSARRRAAQLMMGTALGGALVVISAGQAAAQDECGAPTGSPPTATCTVAGGPYTGGVSYTVAGGLNLVIEEDVEIEGGVAVASTSATADARVNAATGSSIANAAGVGLEVSAVGAANSNVGNVTGATVGIRSGGRGSHVAARTVTGATYAIDSEGGSGGSSVIVNTAVATGDNGAGIRAVSAQGPVTVAAASVETSGDNSTGVHVVAGATTPGVRTISAATVVTHGQGSRGILAEGVGDAVIDILSDTVLTEGGAATGIEVLNANQVMVDSGDVTTAGTGARGISVTSGNPGGQGAIEIRSDSVTTQGEDADGIVVEAVSNNAVTISAGDVTTGANGADGIRASIGGDWSGPRATLTVTAANVMVDGLNSTAVQLINDRGAVNLSLGRVETTRDSSTGVAVEAAGAVDIDAVEVKTAGEGSSGIVAIASEGGAIFANSVITEGAISDAIYASTSPNGLAGNVDDGDHALSIGFGEIATAGAGSDGVVVEVSQAAVSVTGGRLTTGGDSARGVTVLQDGFQTLAPADGDGDVLIDVESIATSGDDSTAVYVRAGGKVVAHVDLVTTDGRESSGFDIETEGNIEVETGRITIAGEDGKAVRAWAAGAGDVTIDAGVIEATIQGGRTDGVDARSDSGAVKVHVDSIELGGAGTAILAQGGGVVVDSGVITMANSGEANAIHVNAAGSASVISDSISIAGADTSGIYVQAVGDAEVTSGVISITGDNSTGIQATSVSGDLTVHAGTVTVIGAEALGVTAEIDEGGVMTMTAGPVTVTGDRSTGVALLTNGEADIGLTDVTATGGEAIALALYGDGGPAEIGFANIVASGENALGARVELQSDASLTLTGGSIAAHGNGAVGTYVFQYDDDNPATPGERITIDVDAITTDGDDAVALAVDGMGDVVVAADEVSTVGDRSDAIRVDSEGAVSIVLGAVSTEGLEARGVVVNEGTDGGGDVYVEVQQSLTTDGDDAAGITVLNSRDVEIRAASVTTLGDRSHAISVTGAATEPMDADLVLRLGTVSTAGAQSGGVSVDNPNTARTINLTAASITTTGDESAALHLYAQDLVDVTLTGDVVTGGAGSYGLEIGADVVDIDLRDVRTTGEGSRAVAAGYEGSARVAARNVSTSGDNSDAVALSGQGAASLILASATTDGADSRAVRVESYGGSVILMANDVATSGGGSMAVYLAGATGLTATLGQVRTVGDQSAGVVVDDTGGQALLTAGSIRTEGDLSAGVSVESTGSVTLDLGQVATAGEESLGVWASASGAITATVDQLTTTGAMSDGMTLYSADDVTMTVGNLAATGEDSSGIIAEGGDVGLTVTGAVRGAEAGARLVALGTTRATLSATGGIEGGAVGLEMSSQEGARIENAGTISAASGLALNIDGAAAVIDNSGRIQGRIDLTDAADTVNNSGTFALGGTSAFGAGEDVFNNTGTVALAESDAPVEAMLAGLERFNNGGAVDLANGVAGDVLTFDGVFNGEAEGAVGADLDLRDSPAVDRLVVGSLEGVTAVRLAVQGQGSVGDTGLVLVQSGVAQAGDEVVVETLGGGFLDYEAVYDDGSRSFRLVAEAAEQAWEPTKVASGAQTQWRRSADVVSARFDELRIGSPRGERAQFWGQAFAGSEEVNGERRFENGGAGPGFVDLTHDVDTRGVQFGADIRRSIGAGDLVLGLTGSLGETELTFQSNGDVSTFSGGGVGAYAQWTVGSLSLGGLVKADRYDMEYRWASAGLTDEADGETVGARLDAAWRIDAGDDWTIEPQSSLSWTDTELGGISDEIAGDVTFGDTTSLVGRLGVRVGTVLTLPTTTLRPFVGLHRLHEFDGENVSHIVLGDDEMIVTDRALGSWSQLTVGADVDSGPIQGFVQGEAFHGQVSGFAARVGVRLNW